MKLFGTRTHGFLDYFMGIFLIASPFMFDLTSDSPQGVVFIMLGLFTLLYSAITRYELGLISILPMKVHLFLDFISGFFLAASPWLFNFDTIVFMPHMVIGIIEMGIALTTRFQPKMQF